MREDMASLIIIDSQGVRNIDLNDYRKETLLIGRNGNECDIAVASAYASGRHLYFIRKFGECFLCDEGSTNGTFLIKGENRVDIRKTGPYKLKEATSICYLGDGGHPGEEAILVFTTQNNGELKSVHLEQGNTLIGRSEDCDIRLLHPMVSRRHAVVSRNADIITIGDMGSLNGVLVNGVAVNKSVQVSRTAVVQIADTVIIIHNGYLLYFRSVSGVSVEVNHIEKKVGKGKKILNDVSLSIGENEFVAIIGGSGAGKTTLMNAISGFDSKLSAGNISVNGADLHKNFDVLKGIIGYVPQQDIIYENLTLRRMLEYTAKMKMDSSVGSAERAERIEKVLEMVELIEHKDTYIRKLSGGQKKRASIAVELLADPKLFFLDEPTSGLDPGTEQNLMKTLKKLSKTQGKTIIMVTHTTQSLNLCDKIIIMGTGGRLCYMGTPEETLNFFETDSLVNVYNMVNSDALMWEKKFKDNNDNNIQSPHKEHEKIKVGNKVSLWNQFKVLTMRYAELMLHDIPRLALLLAQPVIIAVLLGIVAAEEVFDIYEDTKSILFALVCSGIWIGLFNSIQEICKERVILKREYMANLRLPIYILSKYVVQLVLGLVQTLLMLGLFAVLVGIPKEGIIFSSGFVECALTLLLTVMASAAMGLIISAFAKNGDRAMTFAPFILIVQLLFSGILFKLEGAVDVISRVTVSRWAIEGLGSTADLNMLMSKTGIPRQAENLFTHSAQHLWQVWGILMIFVVVFGILASVLLKSVAKDQR